MKRIFVILGHPRSSSFSSALAKSYAAGAVGAGGEVRCAALSEMSFDPILHYGFPTESADSQQDLETCLQEAQANIGWAERLVFAYPNWWGGPPGLLKGFIDRVLLPGFAFQFGTDSPRPKKLLTGRSARLLVTMDSSSEWNLQTYRSAGNNMMCYPILGFCGIQPVEISEFDQVIVSSAEQRESWLAEAQSLGARDARA